MNICDTANTPKKDGIPEIQGIEVIKRKFLLHQEVLILKSLEIETQSLTLKFFLNMKQEHQK
jgi:hypothetical protein